MKRFKNILVFANALTEEDPALEHAERLAKENEAQVTIVDVLDEIPGYVQILMPASWNLRDVMTKDRRDRLEQLAQTLREHGITAQTKLLWGATALEITKEVMRNGHDLVIKTAEGQGRGKEHAYFGTTAIRLMRKCSCPIWVVDPTPGQEYHRMLAAVDLHLDEPKHGGLNGTILELATSLAAMESSELHVVHVWEVYGEEALRHRMKAEEFVGVVDSVQAAAERRLEQLLSKFAPDLPKDRVHLLHGAADQVIAQFVEQLEVDLVVMGTIARTGIPGFLMGNTAEKVLRQVHCTVLTVKPDTFISPVKLEP